MVSGLENRSLRGSKQPGGLAGCQNRRGGGGIWNTKGERTNVRLRKETNKTVLDTAGLEEFSALQDQYLRTGEGFLLVYSVTDEKSFQRVQRLHELILRMKDRDSFPMILVANKVDLIHLRNISSKQGRELAAKYNIPYVETSAKDPPLNVCKVFFDLVRLIRHESSKGSQGEKITKQHSDKAVDFQKLKCTIF
nr:PREDICTED: ras-related protein M-Ras-like isoform X2 [Latimeria chalumnae]|eukprot:XP_014342041.1 PREDICTED: ras-related protein M-Ras-like isoform X2 [Latimeria chalumnae]